jgi:hypothetical protein
MSQKNDLNRPFWLAKLHFYRPRYRERKKRAVLLLLVFEINAGDTFVWWLNFLILGSVLAKKGDLDQGMSHGNTNYQSLFLKYPFSRGFIRKYLDICPKNDLNRPFHVADR